MYNDLIIGGMLLAVVGLSFYAGYKYAYFRVIDSTLTVLQEGKRMVKHYRLSNHDDVIYRAVHAGHPCTKWTMQSSGNYHWHYNLFRELAKEFEFRFGKVHRSWEILRSILSICPRNIPSFGRSKYAKAMKAYPDIECIDNPVEAYQQFYMADKAEFATWDKGRAAPSWWFNK